MNQLLSGGWEGTEPLAWERVTGRLASPLGASGWAAGCLLVSAAAGAVGTTATSGAAGVGVLDLPGEGLRLQAENLKLGCQPSDCLLSALPPPLLHQLGPCAHTAPC